MAIWACLEIESRALLSGKAVAQEFLDISNYYFCSVLHSSISADLKQRNASDRIQAVSSSIHDGVAYHFRTPAPSRATASNSPMGQSQRTTLLSPDGRGFTPGHRGAPAASCILMDSWIRSIQQSRNASRPDRRITVSYTEPSGEEVVVECHEVAYADDIVGAQVFSPLEDPAVIISEEIGVVCQEFEAHNLDIALDKSGCILKYSAGCGRGTRGAPSSLPKLRTSKRVRVAEGKVLPLRSVLRHLGFMRSGLRTDGYCDMMDSRILVARGMFYSRVTAVVKNNAMRQGSQSVSSRVYTNAGVGAGSLLLVRDCFATAGSGRAALHGACISLE